MQKLLPPRRLAAFVAPIVTIATAPDNERPWRAKAAILALCFFLSVAAASFRLVPAPISISLTPLFAASGGGGYSGGNLPTLYLNLSGGGGGGDRGGGGGDRGSGGGNSGGGLDPTLILNGGGNSGGGGNGTLLRRHGCERITPAAGARAYWPTRWPENNVPAPSPSAEGAEAVALLWAVDVCDEPPAAVAAASDGGDWALRVAGVARADYCGSGAGHGCEGVVRVRRLVGCPASAACGAGDNATDCAALPFNADTPLAVLADARALGPDELSVVLEGVELHELRGTHEGNCSYVFPFAVATPGTYRIWVLATHADWDAINELVEGFPRLTLDRPLGDAALVELGDVGAARTVHAAVLAGESVPPCADANPPGRWVARAPLPEGFFARAPAPVPPHGPGHVTTGDGVPFLSNLSVDWAWLPYACRWRSVPADSHACLARALNFRGDSQLRTLFNEFTWRLVGVARAAVKGVEGPTCVDGLRGGSGGILPGFFACFSSDPYGEMRDKFLSGNIEEPHPWLVVTNFGQHFASGTRAKRNYANAMADWATAARDAAQARSDADATFEGLVWVETWPHPVRNDKWVHKYSDGRTPHRLRLLNGIAERALAPLLAVRLRNGTARPLLRVLRTWDMFAPLLDAFPDQSHPEGTVALEPLVAALQHMACGALRHGSMAATGALV